MKELKVSILMHPNIKKQIHETSTISIQQITKHMHQKSNTSKWVNHSILNSYGQDTYIITWMSTEKVAPEILLFQFTNLLKQSTSTEYITNRCILAIVLRLSV